MYSFVTMACKTLHSADNVAVNWLEETAIKSLEIQKGYTVTTTSSQNYNYS